MSNRAISPITAGAIASASFGSITVGAITATGLTAGRSVIVGTGGLLADDAGFTYSTTSDIVTAAGGVIAGMQAQAIRSVAISTTMLVSDFTLLCSTATTSLTVLLPATPYQGQIANVKKLSSDANTLTINGNGRLIDSAATQATAAQNRPTFRIQFDNTLGWSIL